MTKDAARAKARKLCRYPHNTGLACPSCNQIAAALMRAWAAGFDHVYGHETVEGERIRKQADALARGEG